MSEVDEGREEGGGRPDWEEQDQQTLQNILCRTMVKNKCLFCFILTMPQLRDHKSCFFVAMKILKRYFVQNYHIYPSEKEVGEKWLYMSRYFYNVFFVAIFLNY